MMMSRARHGLVLSHAAAVPAQDSRVFAKDPSRFFTSELRASLSDAARLVQWFKAASWDEIVRR